MKGNGLFYKENMSFVCSCCMLSPNMIVLTEAYGFYGCIVSIMCA